MNLILVTSKSKPDTGNAIHRQAGQLAVTSTAPRAALAVKGLQRQTDVMQLGRLTPSCSCMSSATGVSRSTRTSNMCALVRHPAAAALVAQLMLVFHQQHVGGPATPGQTSHSVLHKDICRGGMGTAEAFQTALLLKMSAIINLFNLHLSREEQNNPGIECSCQLLSCSWSAWRLSCIMHCSSESHAAKSGIPSEPGLNVIWNFLPSTFST